MISELDRAERDVEQQSVALKKPLGLRDLVLTQILFVVGSSWVGAAAKLGQAHLFFWLLAILLFYIIRKATSAWPAGLFAGILWLSLSPVIVWSALFKQDMLALALGLGGLAFALTFPPSDQSIVTSDQHAMSLTTGHRSLVTNNTGTGTRIYGAALLFALAFYTKQSALAAAAATTLWLILREPRVGLRFLAALVAGH